MSEAIQKSLDTSATLVVPPLSEEEKSKAKRLVRRLMKQPADQIDTVLQALGLIPYMKDPKSEETK